MIRGQASVTGSNAVLGYKSSGMKPGIISGDVVLLFPPQDRLVVLMAGAGPVV